jgi:hypothetical protein
VHADAPTFDIPSSSKGFKTAQNLGIVATTLIVDEGIGEVAHGRLV